MRARHTADGCSTESIRLRRACTSMRRRRRYQSMRWSTAWSPPCAQVHLPGIRTTDSRSHEECEAHGNLTDEAHDSNIALIAAPSHTVVRLIGSSGFESSLSLSCSQSTSCHWPNLKPIREYVPMRSNPSVSCRPTLDGLGSVIPA